MDFTGIHKFINFTPNLTQQLTTANYTYLIISNKFYANIQVLSAKLFNEGRILDTDIDKTAKSS